MNGYLKCLGSGLMLIFLIITSNAQCPVANFNLSTTACLNQRIQLENLSEPGDYQWDFCAGDFYNAPTAEAQYTLSEANGRPGVDFAKDGDKWYGFVTGTYSNTLYRLEFANGTHRAPTLIQNLGNLSGALNAPGQVRILREGNQWYGLIHNTTTGELVKLSFGDKLSNSVTTTVLLTGIGYINSGLAIGKDDTHGWTCILSISSNQFSIIRLGNTLTTPGSSDIFISAPVPNPNSLADVDLIKVCGNWYGFATNLGNGNIYRLDFGSNLFSTPTITEVTSLAVANPGRLRIAREGDEYFLFVVALDGTLTKLEFGVDLTSSPSLVSEGTIGNILQSNTYGLGISKEKSTWTISTVSLSNGQVFQISYSAMCTATPNASNQINPEIIYPQSGNYVVALENNTSSGVSVNTRSISVSAAQAPDILFTSQNQCANHLVHFTTQNVSGDIINYSWSFGDTNTSSQSAPTHVYAVAGEYDPTLIVTSVNGCQNMARNTISIYSQPLPDFALPAVSPFCTNQGYNFSNTSSFDPASSPSWEWSLNGIVISSAIDLSTQFSSNQPQEIKLKAAISGCESEIIKNISSVQTGPLADFTFSNGCQDTLISFTNLTTGAVVKYAWNFGDGKTSVQQDGVTVYSNSGKYPVTLEATNSAGCHNFATKEITIYSKPQPNFTLELPPFSCSGSPSQFNDLTPPLTDSNIASRLWSFGDVNNGTAIQTNPTYTYNQAGDYPVSLGVTSNFGCSSTIQKTITIQPSPTINFTNTPACLNQPTQFTDASGADVKAWLWTIQNSSYTTRNVTHEFSTTGLQNAMLTVTGSNNCVSEISKTITIPVPVSIDFTTQSTCATKPAVFMQKNSGGADPAVFSTWDFAGQPGSGSPAQHVFSSVGSYQVTLSSTRLSGCVYSVTKSVNIIQPPVARFTMTPESGGAPLTVDFTNTSLSATNFLWKFSDASNSTSAQISPSFVFDQLGTYAVKLIASNAIGCTDSVKKDVQVVVPQINAVLSGFWLKGNADGTLNATVTIENKGNITITNPEVYLDLSGVTEIKERISGTIPPNQSITRTLTSTILPVNLKYACAEVFITEDANTFDNRECTNLENEITFIQPYPNPANDIIYLDWINQDLESIQFIIYNSTGQAVLNQTYSNLLHGLNQVEINVSQLAPGIYLASYSTGNNLFSFRFSVNR